MPSWCSAKPEVFAKIQDGRHRRHIGNSYKRNGSGKHRPIWMKFWHYFSCDIPAFLIFAPKFPSILWLRASLQSLISSGGEGGGWIFPAFYKYLSLFQLWLACDIKIRSENAQHLQYNYLGEWELLCSQWTTVAERGGGCKFSPLASLIFVLFQVVTFRQQQRSFKNYLKCNSATALMNENLYATSEEQWRKKGSKFPPNQWKIFIFQVVTFREHHYLAKYCLKCGGAIGLINEVIYPLPLNNSGWIWDSRRNVGLNPPELLRFSFLNCDLPTNSVRIACNHAEISPSQTGPLRL